MKIRLPFLVAALFLPPFGNVGASAVTTVPFGFESFGLPATGPTQTTTTYLGLPLLSPAVYSGGVASLTAKTLTATGTPWTSGQFAVVGSPYFLEITSGKQAGRFLRITGNTASTLTLDVSDGSTQTTGLNATGFAVVANDSFEIVAGDTLASLLGDGTTAHPLLLRGGTSATKADTVSIYNAALAKSVVYYFNTTRNAWNSTTSTASQNAIVLTPSTVLGITRIPNGTATGFVIDGVVPTVAPLTKSVGGGTRIEGFTRLPVDIALSGLNFTNWVKNTNPRFADTVGLWNSTLASWQVYYQLPDQGSVPGQWRLTGDTTTNYSSLVIPSGTGLQIIKHFNASGIKSFLAEPLPY